MSYELVIGEKNYSSWSMRAWLLLEFLGAPYTEISVPLFTPQAYGRVKALGGQAGLVPVLRDGDLAIWDTLAIYEYLHERHSGVWPHDRCDRARARSLCCEFHSGMGALREDMPMNIRARHRSTVLADRLKMDIERVQAIWRDCLNASGGPWLFGAVTGADMFFAAVATRFQTYGVAVAGDTMPYCQRLLDYPLVQRWRDLAEAEQSRIERFEHPRAGKNSAS